MSNITGWGNIDSSDVTIPKGKLGQNNTHEGKFYFGKNASDPQAKVFKKMTECRVLVPIKDRVLYNGNGPARCASDNHIVPSPRIADPICKTCAICPMQMWDDEGKEARIEMAKETKPRSYDPNKPLCKEGYNPLMQSNEMGLFFMQFQGTQVKNFKVNLLTHILTGFPGRHPSTIKFDMELVRAGTYYNVKFDNFMLEHDEDKAAQAMAMSQQFQDKAPMLLGQIHADMDAAKDDDDFKGQF